MKKIMLVCFALLLSVFMAACGNKGNNETDNNVNGTNTDVSDTTNDNNTDGTDTGGKDTANDNQMDDGDNNTDNNGDTKMEVAEEAADRVADIEEVDNATVIVTDNNAYAAVVLNDTHDEVTSELEDKIAEAVRETNNNIDNVYVSMNPDFVNRMSDYVTKINEGHPISGFFEEFTESVRDVFPDAH